VCLEKSCIQAVCSVRLHTQTRNKMVYNKTNNKPQGRLYRRRSQTLPRQYLHCLPLPHRTMTQLLTEMSTRNNFWV